MFDWIFTTILDVNASPYQTYPGTTIHIYVTVNVTWSVLDFSSFLVEAFYNGTAISTKVIFIIGSGHDTFTLDFAWNTSSLEPGSYQVSAATSTGASYEDGYVRILQTLTVPDDHPTIQAAINAANEGDTIFVRNGTYEENLNITKKLTILGENVQGTIVYSFEVHADNVTISGFQTHWELGTGIVLYDACYCNISNNQVGSKTYGIWLDNSSHNYITNNHIHQALYWGITLFYGCNDNTIRQNSIARSHLEIGIFIMGSNNNTLDSNDLSHNYWPLVINDAASNRIYHNNIIDSHNRPSLYNAPNTSWDNGCEGNYWSDYQDRYPNASHDWYGIWNTSYIIDAENVDRYPLRNLYWNIADLNHDLKVDIFDLVSMCASYCLDWQEHMCHVDVAEPYGIIDIFDVVAVAVNYGKEYVP